MPIGIVIHGVSLILVGLCFKTIELYLELVNITRYVFELGFGPPGFILFLLKFGDKFGVVVLSLKKSFVESSIIGFAVASSPFQSFELIDVLIKQIG